MNEIKREEVGSGIYFTRIKDERFKVNRISVNFFTDLNSETVTTNAVLPFILSRCSSAFPTPKEMSQKLSSLYGAYLDGDVSKLGETQIIDLSISSIDDRYALENEQILKELTVMLTDAILHPVLENGVFPEKSVSIALSNHIDALEAELNEKQQYAVMRGVQILCENEAAGLNKYGTIEQAKQVTSKMLFDAYQNLLKTARIEIIAVGCNDFVEAKDILVKAFNGLDRAPVFDKKPEKSKLKPEVKEITEEMDISQCKMVLGFKVASDDFASMLLFQKIYGGTATSKLFVNVREKLSLCYYCAARYDDLKGTLLVHSGVEKENIEQAREEILAQLEDMKNQQITDDELQHAILDIKNSAATVYDTASGIESWYLSRIYRGDLLSPNDFAEKYTKATKESIAAAAKSIQLDCVFLLVSHEEEEA